MEDAFSFYNNLFSAMFKQIWKDILILDDSHLLDCWQPGGVVDMQEREEESQVAAEVGLIPQAKVGTSMHVDG